MLNCRIEHLLSGSLDSMDQSLPVQQGVALMAERNIGSLVITDQNRFIGLFIERDLITRVVGPGRDVGDVTLGEVCTRKLISISSESSCQDAITCMEKHSCRRLMVYRGERFVGLLNLTDVASALARSRNRNNMTVNLVAGLSPAAIVGVIALLFYNFPRILQLSDGAMN